MNYPGQGLSGRYVIVQMDNGNLPLNLREVTAYDIVGAWEVEMFVKCKKLGLEKAWHITGSGQLKILQIRGGKARKVPHLTWKCKWVGETD